MRWHRSLLVVAAAALIAGCGNRHLVLQVDVLSYLDPSLTDFSFGPVPPVPGGLYTGEQKLLEDVEVNLLEGTGSVAEVQSVSIAMSVIASDSTGAGTDTLRLYLSDPSVDPLTTTPAVILPITFVPGVTDTVAVDLGSDSRVAELFTDKRMRLTLTAAVHGPESGDPLNARVRLTGLDAVVVAGRKGDL